MYLYWTTYVLCCEHSLNSKQPVNNVNVFVCVCVYTSVRV